MATLLPDELWRMIVESAADISTLRSLLFVSHRLRLLTEPVLLQNVTIVVNDPNRDRSPLTPINPPAESVLATTIGDDRSPLLPFHDFITSANGYRCFYLRHFTVSFPGREPSTQDINILNDIVPKFSQLKSLSLSIDSPSNVQERITIFSNPQLEFSLRRFTLFLKRYNNIPNLANFLASQRSLEHLELLPFVSQDLFGNPITFRQLRHLHGSLTFALAALASLEGITHLKTYFHQDSPVGRINGAQLAALHTLSCRVHDRDTFFQFMSRAKNIKFLEIYNHHTWNIGEPSWDTLAGLRGARIEHIRFVVTPAWAAHHVRKLFKSATRLPSLRCIEVQVLSRHCHPRRPESSYASRWYQGKTEPVAVEWTCPVGEEWFHDWDRDFRTLE